jgi:hypothetical protein
MEANQRFETLDSSFETVRQPSKPSGALLRHAPPADCDIELLLGWTYQRQQAHRHAKFAVSGGPGGYVDSTVMCEMNAAIGGRQPRALFGFDPITGVEADQIHPDALAVHARTAALDELSIGLIIQHSWQRTRPDHGGELMPLQPLRSGKGKIKFMNDAHGHTIGAKLDPSELDYNAMVLTMRERYLHWWNALLIMRVECEWHLPHLTITGPAAPERPWMKKAG